MPIYGTPPCWRVQRRRRLSVSWHVLSTFDRHQEPELPRRDPPPQVGQREVVERRDEDLVEHPGVLDDAQHVVLEARVEHDGVLELDVDGDAGPSEQVQDLTEGGDLDVAPAREAVGEVTLAEMLQGLVHDAAEAVRGPVDGLVVDGHDLTVRGALHVQLDSVGAHLQRQLEGGEGVLGRVRARAPMGPDLCHRPIFPRSSPAVLIAKAAAGGWTLEKHGEVPGPAIGHGPKDGQ